MSEVPLSSSSRWPTRFNRRAIGALALAAITFLALNICVSLGPPLRLDFTAGRIYTLSPVTRAMLRKMPEKVHLRFYVSRALSESSGGYAAYAAHVREVLALYAAKSHGKIALEIIDPENYSPEEDRAIGFGLRGVPIPGGDEQAYFGIVGTNTTDAVETIPFLAPEREPFLEYDITKMIMALEENQRRIVGVIDDAGALGGAHPWAALEQARQQFTLRQIVPNNAKIDSDIGVLLVLHPKNLDPTALFAIDQFVLGGGHALIFVDPDAESVAPVGSSAAPSYVNGAEQTGGGASDLEPLFKAWGIGYDPAKIVGDWGQAMRIEAESFGRPVVTEFPPYIAGKPPYLNANDPVTGDLKIVNLVTAGALTPLPGAATTFTPLIQTSPHAALLDVGDATGDPLGLVAKYAPGAQTYTLAARVTGNARTAFAGGPPQGHAGAKESGGPYLTQAQKPIEVIVAADVDMLADRSWVETRDVGSTRIVLPFANNGDFLLSALENLSGGAQLSTLRARGLSSRPLTRIEDLQRAADDRYRATEESLAQKLEETRRRLLTLAPESGGGKTLLSAEQQDAAKRYRTEMTEERRALRAVEHDLRRSIDRLETAIKLANVLLMPLAVIVFALLVAWRKPFRRRA